MPTIHWPAVSTVNNDDTVRGQTEYASHLYSRGLVATPLPRVHCIKGGDEQPQRRVPWLMNSSVVRGEGGEASCASALCCAWFRSETRTFADGSSVGFRRSWDRSNSRSSGARYFTDTFARDFPHLLNHCQKLLSE